MPRESLVDEFIQDGKHSETLLINQHSIARAEKKQPVFKFGFGQSPFPVPDSIVAALADAAPRKEYMDVQGALPLRQAISEFHNTLENKQWKSSQIIVGSGSKILLFCIMAAFKKAEILLPSPSWVSYEPQGKLAGHQVNWIQTEISERWLVTAELLEQYCVTRLNKTIPLILILNYPSNPTGQTYNQEQLKSLAAVMKKHNVIVIADEIYSLLSYQEEQASLDHYYPEGCIVSSGLSKWCGAGGWRLGFIHIPEELGEKLFNAVIGVASETYSCAPSPVQVAATRAYQNKALATEFLQRQIKLLKQVSEYCCVRLKAASVDVHPAQGGFYLFPDFSLYADRLSKKGILTSEQLTGRLMEETGVALLPGSAFGMPQERLVTRLAFVDFDGAQVWHSAKTEAEYDKVKIGINLLCSWLTDL